MIWIKLSQVFPDDWERKIIREVGQKTAIDNGNWQHINDRFENTFDYRVRQYFELE